MNVNRRDFLRRIAATTLGLAAGGRFLRSAAAAAAARRPNIVFILVDDLGWHDVGCYGSRIYHTPSIDRLATQGMRFTDGYAACPVCSPTRASILTGKYPARLHLTDWIPGSRRWGKLRPPEWTKYMPLEEVTIAEALKKAGYACGHVGKWHLGGPKYRPEAQGFDFNFAGDHRGQPPSYFWPYRIPNVKTGKPGEYLTDRSTDEALGFIERNKNRPFFLYFAHYAVHTPLQAKKEKIQKYLKLGLPPRGQNNATYAAMIESVDESVGRVVAKLDELGIADNTVIFFMSDNGGLHRVTSNAPLRAGKGTLYEGGIREPWIVKWPGVVEPGSTCSVPVISTDFYPTILEIAGLKPDPKQAPDGVSIVPLLKQTGTIDREALYWHYPHYHIGPPGGAIRCGDWKLIEYYEDGRLELYNLRNDLSEKTNLAARMPQKAAELRKKLDSWRKAVGAQMPRPNPNYRRDKKNPRRKPPGRK